MGLHPVPLKAFCIRDEFCGITLRLRIHKGAENTWGRDEAEERKERDQDSNYLLLLREVERRIFRGQSSPQVHDAFFCEIPLAVESWPREKLVIEAAVSCCALASEVSAAAEEQSAVVTMWGEALIQHCPS